MLFQHRTNNDNRPLYLLLSGFNLGGATRLLGSFYSQAKAIDTAQKSSSSSSSGIDKALEGEPIITWTCAVLKECLRSQGGRLTRKKNTSFGGRSFTWWWKVGLSSRLKVYSAWFLQTYLLSQKPRGCNDTGKVLFLDAQKQTTRQQSRTTALARVHRLHRLSHPLMVHMPSAFRLVNFTRNFFRGSVAISIKRNCLSSFWKKKKLVWFCEWAIIIMSGCSWNFSSEPCSGFVHSVVTVKTVVHFNHANIFCTSRNKIRCRQFVMRSRTIYQKNRRCRWNKKVKDNSNARECDEKSFLRGAWRDRDTNDIFAHCSLIFYFLDFKFSKFVCPSELHPFIWSFFKNFFRKKKNIQKTTKNALAPSIFMVLSIVLKLDTPLLHTQAQNTLLQNF